MRKALAGACIVLASVTFGIGLGRSAGLSSAPAATEPTEYGYVQIAYERDDALDGRNCPHPLETESKTSDV